MTKPDATCDHDFVFLRQERKNVGYDRNPTWIVEDLFHCRKCLAYKRVAVERRTPRTDSYDEYVTRLI